LESFWVALKAIFVKDVIVELRARQVLPTMVVLGMLIVYILRLVSEPASGAAVVLCVFEVIIVPVVLIVFRLSVGARWPDLLAVLLLGNVGISSVGTLFSAAVQLARTRGSLLSIIVLVILMPLMVPATFALLVLFGALPEEVGGSGSLAFVGSFKAAAGYMLAFDAVFVVACWLLFAVVVEE